MNKVSKRPFWAIPGAILLFAFYAVAVIYGTLIEQPCNGIDKPSLWCYLHPLTALKVIFLIMSGLGALIQGGYWIAFSSEKNKDGTPARDGGDNWFVNAGGLLIMIVFFILAVFI